VTSVKPGVVYELPKCLSDELSLMRQLGVIPHTATSENGQPQHDTWRNQPA
jgi:hypothetical protein